MGIINRGISIGGYQQASASGKFFLRDTTSNPEGARQRHLTRSGSQTQHKIWRLLLAHEISLTIKRCKMPTVFQTCVRNELTIMQDAITVFVCFFFFHSGIKQQIG